MGKILYICQQCRKARGTEEIKFRTGAVMWMCQACVHNGWDEFAD
jgi:hypothetical protein